MWKPIPEKVDLDYLAYFFTTSCGISLAAAASPGGAGRNKTLNRSTFEEASILLPPVAEQKKLVDILASVDEAIQANEKVFKQTDKVKQGILERLMVKTISDDDAAKSPQWETKNLGEIANVFNGPGKKSGGSIVRIFKTKHVYDGFIREDTPEYLPDDLEHTIDEFDFLKEGDVLTPNMAHSTIGRVAYVRKLGYPAICDGQVMVIRAKNGAVKPRFLFDFLSSRAGRSELLAREVGSIFGPARGQTHLYPRDVRTIQLPLPPPKVQEKLSAIETLDVQMEKTSQLLSQLRVLKEGLLQNLLSGKVRVRL